MNIGRDLVLISKVAYSSVQDKKKKVAAEKNKLESTVVKPSKGINDKLAEINTSSISNPTKLSQILKRPNVSYQDMLKIDDTLKPLAYYEKVQLEIDIKYEGYIKRELMNVKKLEKIDSIKIPEGFNYSSINGLSNEIREKLERFRPYSLGQAARISGVTPAAISLLMVKLHNSNRNVFQSQ